MWSRVHFLKLAHIVFRSSLFCDLRLLLFWFPGTPTPRLSFTNKLASISENRGQITENSEFTEFSLENSRIFKQFLEHFNDLKF